MEMNAQSCPLLLNGIMEHILNLGFKDLENNEERLLWVKANLSGGHSPTDANVSASKSSSKSVSDSEKYRNEGNKYFKDKLYKKALDLYTKSMIAAPSPDEEDNDDKYLAKSLCNRSAALFYLQEYDACLIDIEGALQAGYPEKQKKYLLYTRQVKCLIALQRGEESKLAFDKVVELLSESKLEADEQTGFRKKLEKHMGDSTTMPNPHVKHPERTEVGLPRLPHGGNASHPSLSSSCKVVYAADKGRYVVATRDIRPGEVILVEEPYSALLYQRHHEDYCDYCYGKLTIAPLACQCCTRVLFCSPLCRDNAWASYHSYECPMATMSLFHKNPMHHLALRTVLVTGLDELLKYTDESTASGTMHGDMAGCNEQGQYKSNDFNTIKHLVDHFDKLSRREMLTIALPSVQMTNFLENLNFFQSIPAQDKQVAIVCVGKCLMQTIQAIAVNAASIEAAVFTGTYLDDPDYCHIGQCLYPTYALFNHSCDRNTHRAAYAKSAVLHATRTIKEGDEVTTLYGKGYLYNTKKDRQIARQETYKFNCSCEACLEDWPLRDAMIPQPAQFKCKYCQHPLPTSPGGQPQAGKMCPGCSKRQNVPSTEAVLQHSVKKHREALLRISVKRFSEALVVLVSEIERLENLLVTPRNHEEYLSCIESLSECCGLMGNMRMG